MLIQCPDCQTKMKPTPPADTKPGVKVSVTCRCGTRLRFTMPGKPTATGYSDTLDKMMREMFDAAKVKP